MSVIFAILLFSVLIFVHELGHFTAAKLSGVQVNEFSMFMGPAIWKKQVGETLYAIRCIPIGGYCAMEGEDEDTGDERAFTRQSGWKKFIITSEPEFEHYFGRRADKKRKLYNGMIKCDYYMYTDNSRKNQKRDDKK